MKVYRVLCKNELDKILNNSCGELGNFCNQYREHNNHRYKNNRKYLHFFLRKNSCKYLPIYDDTNLFLCTFNIPLKILWKHIGKGYYPSLNKKNSMGYNPVVVKLYEFAIDSELFKADWLVEYEAFKMQDENLTLDI